MKSKYLVVLRQIISIIIMVATVTFLAYHFWPQVWYVISGEFLGIRFRLPSECGGDSYQVGINKYLIITIFLSAIGIPTVLGVRWLADRSNTLGRWSFNLFSSAVFLFPLSFLSIVSYAILQYIWSMGFTFRRLLGLGISGLTFIFLVATWAWSIGLLKRKG